MTLTITKLFDSHSEALRAVHSLEAAGFSHNQTSILSNHREVDSPAYRPSEDVEDSDATIGAMSGATTGGIAGGSAGLLAGLGILAIPGLGPVVAAGWLASAAVGAALGAVAGGATGGLLGALTNAGHTGDEAQIFAEGVRRGGSIVSVKCEGDDAVRAQAILNEHNAVDITTRGDLYRRDGWNGYDVNALPLSATEIVRQRSLYL